ncbi:MAG: FkbM family methyltransferase [Acidobacteriota bacterium]
MSVLRKRLGDTVIQRYLSRIGEVMRYAVKAQDPRATLNMAVLGFARGHPFSGAGCVSRLGRRLYPELIVRASLFHGLSLHLDPADVSHLVIAEEFIVANVYRLGMLQFQPEAVLDCGAHIGMFTLQAAGHFPGVRMMSFEPDESNLHWLRRQVDDNGLMVDVVPSAVTITTGEAWFAPSSSCGGALATRSIQADSVVVSTVRLADVISRLNVQRLLLKIDIEGEEVALLPDIVGVLPRTCAIFLETHHGESGWREAASLLEDNAFVTSVIRQRGLFTDGSAIRR